MLESDVNGIIDDWGKAVAKNEKLAEEAEDILDAQYHKGFADGIRSMMFGILHRHWGSRRDAEWFNLQIHDSVHRARKNIG